MSSGSSRAESPVDPTRSQNITVSWRRSARGVALLDGGDDGEVGLTANIAGPVILPPQFPQNRAATGFFAPHWGQKIGNALPQVVQNFVPTRLV